MIVLLPYSLFILYDDHGRHLRIFLVRVNCKIRTLFDIQNNFSNFPRNRLTLARNSLLVFFYKSNLYQTSRRGHCPFEFFLRGQFPVLALSIDAYDIDGRSLISSNRRKHRTGPYSTQTCTSLKRPSHGRYRTFQILQRSRNAGI